MPFIESNSFSFVLRSKKLWHLPQGKLNEYTEAFPSLDVEAELRKAAQWLRDNPKKRKTAGGMTRFLGGWLGRAKPKLKNPLETICHDATDEEADELFAEMKA